MKTPAVLEPFISDCRRALASDSPGPTIAARMSELVADHQALAAQIPAFAEHEVETSARGWRLGGEAVLYGDDDLTVMVLDTLPGIEQPPHDHAMNAYIAVFEGCEEQRFWKRSADGVEATVGRHLHAGQVMPLGVRAIHAISAADRPARAIHVYLGDIYAVERSIFHPDTLAELQMTTDRYDEFCRPLS